MNKLLKFATLLLCIGFATCRRRCMRLGSEGENVIDLTHAHNSKAFNHPVWGEPFELTKVEIDSSVAGNRFSTAEHSGTHLDAPAHFYSTKNTVDTVPLKSVMGRGVLINLVKEDGLPISNDYRITSQDILDFEAIHGKIPRKYIILFRTGFDQYYPDQMNKYMGTEDVKNYTSYNFPSLTREAAEFIVNKRNIRAVGFDVSSADYGSSRGDWAHRILLQNDVIILENVANLHMLVDKPNDFHVLALPMKIEGGTGAPMRIVAIIDDFQVNDDDED